MSGVAGDLVWYIAYGSNLSRQRFHSYLDGTRPPGASRPMRGARDATPPARVEPCLVPGRLRFARHSRVWNGGVAFLDPEADGSVWARRYLLTWAQFEDVFAQENGRAETASLTAHRRGGIVGTKGWYRRLVALADHDGHPSVTFTDPEPAPAAPPSRPYLEQLVLGLQEAHHRSVLEIAGYLWTAAGVGGAARSTGDAASTPS